MKLRTFIIFIVIVFILQGAVNFYRVGFDSTDNYLTGQRSGLALYTDKATGVQYVTAGFFGGITPRINIDGTIYKEVLNNEQHN